MIGVLLIIASLTSGVLSPLGITSDTELVLILGMIIATIVAGISYFFLRPIPTREVDEQNNQDSANSPDHKRIQPAQQLR